MPKLDTTARLLLKALEQNRRKQMELQQKILEIREALKLAGVDPDKLEKEKRP